MSDSITSRPERGHNPADIIRSALAHPELAIPVIALLMTAGVELSGQNIVVQVDPPQTGSVDLRPRIPSARNEGATNDELAYWRGKVNHFLSDEFNKPTTLEVTIDSGWSKSDQARIFHTVHDSYVIFYNQFGFLRAPDKELTIKFNSSQSRYYENKGGSVIELMKVNEYILRHEMFHYFLYDKFDESPDRPYYPSSFWSEGYIEFLTNIGNASYQSGLPESQLENMALAGRLSSGVRHPDPKTARENYDVAVYIFRQLFSRLERLPKYKNVQRDLGKFIMESKKPLTHQDLSKWLNKYTNGTAERILTNYGLVKQPSSD